MLSSLFILFLAHVAHTTTPHTRDALWSAPAPSFSQQEDVTSDLDNYEQMSLEEYALTLCTTHGCCGNISPIVHAFNLTSGPTVVPMADGKGDFVENPVTKRCEFVQSSTNTQPGDEKRTELLGMTASSPVGESVWQAVHYRVAPRGIGIDFSKGIATLPEGVERLTLKNVVTPWLSKDFVRPLMDFVCRRAVKRENVAVDLYNGNIRPEQFFGSANKTGVLSNDTEVQLTDWANKINAVWPDLLIVGNTKLNNHVQKGELMDLSWHIQEYAKSEGTLLVDTTLPQLLTDFQSSNSWWALPLTTETRTLLYNATTLENLNLPKPPPDHDGSIWGEAQSTTSFQTYPTYTWDSFLDVLALPAARLLGNGSVNFNAGWDEEFKLLSLIGRESNGNIFMRQRNTTTFLCGATQPTFLRSLNSTLSGLLSTFEPHFYNVKDRQLSNWLSRWPQVDPTIAPYYPVTLSPFNRPVSAFAFTTDTPDFRCSDEIRTALLPGTHQFVGSITIALTRPKDPSVDNRDLAFGLMALATDRRHIHIHAVNHAMNRVPPYMDAWTMAHWNRRAYRVQYMSASRGVQAYHPYTQPPQMDDIETAKPLRAMLLEVVYKNSTMDQAANRACSAFNLLLKERCTVDHIQLADASAQCNPSTAQYSAAFVWGSIGTQPAGPPCRQTDLVQLPPPYSGRCDFVGRLSAQAIIGYLISAATLIYTCAVGVSFYRLRQQKPVRSASPFFCLLILIGCVLLLLANGLIPGPPTRWRLLAAAGLMSFGLGLILASLLLKLWRIEIIFNGSRSLKSLRLTDQCLALPLALLLAIEAILITLLFIFQPIIPTTTNQPIPAQTRTLYIQLETTKVHVDASLILIGVYNVGLLATACVVSWWIRHVLAQFRESKFILAIVWQFAAIGLFVFPVVFLVPDPATRYLVWVISVCFSILFLVTLLFVPKIFACKFPLKTWLHARGLFVGPHKNSHRRTPEPDPEIQGGSNPPLHISNELPRQEATRGSDDEDSGDEMGPDEAIQLYRERMADMQEKLIRLGNYHMGVFKPQIEVEPLFSAIRKNTKRPQYQPQQSEPLTAGKRSSSLTNLKNQIAGGGGSLFGKGEIVVDNVQPGRGLVADSRGFKLKDKLPMRMAQTERDPSPPTYDMWQGGKVA